MKIYKTGNSLQNALNALKNPKPALDKVGDILVQSTIARLLFTKKNPITGNQWPRWALGTLKARERKGNDSQGLLVDSGRLSQSIRKQIQGRRVVVGSQGVPYAQFLQNGTNRMPARPFIGISPEDRRDIHSAMVEYFKDKK